MVYCVVANCKSQHGKSANGEKISFHRFPVAKKLRMDWENRIGQKNLKYSVQSIKAARLCSLHFSEDCYSVSRKTATSVGHTFLRWKLKDDAVPTLLIDEPFFESVECPKPDESRVMLGSAEQEPFVDPRKSIHFNHPMITDNCVKGMIRQANQMEESHNSRKINISFAKDNNLQIAPERSPASTEKYSDFNTCSKVECIESSYILPHLKFSSSIDTCSKIDKPTATQVEHVCKDCQEDSLPAHRSNAKISEREIHILDCISGIKNSDSQSQESDEVSMLLCEICGLNFVDEVILNDHLIDCKLNNDRSLDDGERQITDNFPMDVNERNGQVEKLSQVSSSIQITPVDYESLSAYTLFVCACGFTASSSEELMDHTADHLFEESFMCMVCKLVFNNYLLLQQHVHESRHFWTNRGKLPTPSPASKPEPTSIPAPNFTSQLVQNSSLAPLSKCTGSDYSSHGKVGALDLTINGLKSVGAPLKCGLCPFSSSSARDLLNHRKTHISSLAQKSESEKMDMSCSITKMTVEDKDLLKCDSCSYSTKSAIELLQHKTFHGAEGPFRCNTCSYATKSAIDLLQHKKEKSCSEKHFSNCCSPSSKVRK